MDPLRVLVIDDTAIYRKIVSEVLRDVPGVEVVGTAIDGRLALEKIEELKPDLVTLDLEMPCIGGVEVLERLRAAHNPVGVIMLSAFTSTGADATTEALRLGAFDFVLKPSGASLVENAEQLRQKLAERIAAWAHRQGRELPVASVRARVDTPAPRIESAPRGVPSRTSDEPPELIVLGISTGGPEALTRVIPRLPAHLPPLFIVQHMPPLFTRSLADDLNSRSALNVREAVDGQLARPGDCLIAPGGRQMKIERTESGPIARITDDPPENSCRPSVDYLFRSAAQQYGARVLAVIMTGMGSDGTLGCRQLKRLNASVIAQNRETCVVYGMPSQVIAEGLADAVVPLDEIPECIARLAGDGVPA